MDTVSIREAIAVALAHEARTGELDYLLTQRVRRLHPAITVPGERPVEALLDFVERYAHHVADYLDAMQAISRTLGTEDMADAVAYASSDFFCNPPALLSGHQGLNAVMNEAYLAHRLVEEINDYSMHHRGSLLLPMDMTRSNLIIHHLIGEPFANQLDEAVEFLAGEMTAEGEFDQRRRDEPGGSMSQWRDQLRSWPCLVDNLADELLLYAGWGRTPLH
jgi:hypothetical protein